MGEEGQRHLNQSTAVLIGCGATGTALSNLLVRAGIGRLRVVDRDFIELHNLQRQSLFDEADIAANLPKAEAAAARLRQINSGVAIEATVTDFGPGNCLALVDDASIVLDGTDNFQTRYLINDACLRLRKPWIYTGVVASYGMTATFIPDGAAVTLPSAERKPRASTGCLRCFLGNMPAPGTSATCDTAGVLGPAVALVTAIAAAEAIKVLTGRGKLNPGIIHVDVWNHEYETLSGIPRDPKCPACQHHQYDFLNAIQGTTTAALCGRDAVQIAVTNGSHLDLAKLEKQLSAVATKQMRNSYLLRSQIDDFEFTIFPDNRAIIKGTDDETLAKSLFARYIGH